MVIAKRIRIIMKCNEPLPARCEECDSEQCKRKKDGLYIYVGPPWTEDDLKSFYVAYWQNPKDWIKISSMLNNRTPYMVEYLYKMNRAYLSRSKRFTSATGLIRSVMDHDKSLEKLYQKDQSGTPVFNKSGLNMDCGALLQESQEIKVQVKRKRRKGQENHCRTSKLQTLEIGICTNGARKYEEVEGYMDIKVAVGTQHKEVQKKGSPLSPPEGRSNLYTLADAACMILNGLAFLPGLYSGH